jgi:hypothetical protein
MDKNVRVIREVGNLVLIEKKFETITAFEINIEQH